MSVYVAAPDHPIHQEPEPLSEVTRVKYRGIAVADTARERPVLTVQLLDKQQRLTVSTIEDKRLALLAGLGVATMPYPMVEKDIEAGRCAWWGRNTAAKPISSWPGGATAWGRRKPGSCAKFRACSRSANVGWMTSPCRAARGFFFSRSAGRGRAARPDPAPARWK